MEEAGKRGALPAAVAELERRQRENPDDPCVDYALGFYYRSYQGDYARALNYLRRAMERNPGYYGPHLDVGLIHHARRQYDPARTSLLEAIELAKKAGDPSGEAGAKIELGVLYRYDGDTDKALKYLSEAAQLSQNNIKLKSTALMRMAEVLGIDLGEYEEAKKICAEVLDLLKAAGETYGVAYTYNVLGNVHLAAGDRAVDMNRAHAEYQEASARYQQTLQAMNPRYKPKLLVALGDVHLRDGDLAAALSYYESFLQETPDSDRSFKEERSRALGGLGEIALLRGEHGKALGYFRQAADLAVEDKIKKLEMSWVKKIGDAYAEMGEYAQALAHYDTVLETVRDGFLALGSAPGEEYVFFNDEFKVYEAAVDLLLKSGQARRAFDYLERSREQSMLQTLFQSRIVEKLLEGPARDQFLDELALLKQDLESRHRARLAALEKMEKSPKPERRRWQDELRNLEAGIGELYGRLVNSVRKMLRGRYQPNLAAEIQARVLQENETLVEYMVADQKTFVFIITKDAFHQEVIPVGRKGYQVSRAGKKEAATSLDQLVQAVSPLLFPSPGEGSPDRPSIDATSANINLRALWKLYETIFFHPVEKHLRAGSQLIIVPDDVLYYLPFDMLVTGFQARGVPSYLLSKYPISYSYSAGLLLELGKTSDSQELLSLLIGNPDFGPASEIKGALGDRLRSSRFLVGKSLPPLPFAQQEVERISEITGNRLKLTGAQATEAAFKRNAARAGIIHLATHSFFNRHNYLDSNIIFALNERIDQQGEDGVLYLHEIMGLRLKALMVVLTGCETGLGRLRRGGGLEGISRAFLSAGVPSIVGTLWPVVDSKATSKLMADFYEQLARGKNKREALQNAKLAMLVADPYADPFFWAAPILIGDTHAAKIAGNAPFFVKLVKSRRLLIVAIIGSIFLLTLVCYWLVVNRRASQSAQRSER